MLKEKELVWNRKNMIDYMNNNKEKMTRIEDYKKKFRKDM